VRSGRRSSRSARIRKRQRDLPVRGEGADEGRYYRCRVCGFICDRDRDALDDSPPGTDIRVATLAAGRVLGDERSVSFRLGPPIILARADSSGTKRVVYIERDARVSSGCPMCGTHAWKS
jgi:hypothetical protein